MKYWHWTPGRRGQKPVWDIVQYMYILDFIWIITSYCAWESADTLYIYFIFCLIFLLLTLCWPTIVHIHYLPAINCSFHCLFLVWTQKITSLTKNTSSKLALWLWRKTLSAQFPVLKNRFETFPPLYTQPPFPAKNLSQSLPDKPTWPVHILHDVTSMINFYVVQQEEIYLSFVPVYGMLLSFVSYCTRLHRRLHSVGTYNNRSTMNGKESGRMRSLPNRGINSEFSCKTTDTL